MPDPAAPSRFALGAAIDSVRRFNRFYARQIGVLHENDLGSRFSLVEMRVLYEWAHRDGLSAAQLSKDLGLDPGYLSRMIQRFEIEKLLARSRSETDARQRVFSLTARGRETFARLEARSGEQVAAILAKLGPGAQRRLLDAMSTIEGLLEPKTKPNAP